MSKLKRVKKAIKELKVIGWEILTSTAHLIAVIPKFISVLLNLIAEVDNVNEWVELVLEWFKNNSKEAKKKI